MVSRRHNRPFAKSQLDPKGRSAADASTFDIIEQVKCGVRTYKNTLDVQVKINDTNTRYRKNIIR